MLKCLMLLALAFPAMARERLILVGGGSPPAAGLAALANWSGGTRARILLITWSTDQPQVVYDYLKDELAPHKIKELLLSPTPEEMDTQSERFYQQLEAATGVYFTGGDQNDFMSVVQKHPMVKTLLRRKMARGVPIYGTSAGTAVMAQTMFTGNYNVNSPKVAGGELLGIDPAAVIMASGLGLLRGILVDQHFFVRHRQNRFWSAFSVSPESLGLAIDEATGVILEDQRWVKVVGRSQVMAVKRGTSGAPDQVYHLKPGESLDLARFRKMH